MPSHHRILDPGKAESFKSQCALAVMTKVPRAGHVKTRLVPPLTPEEAADWVSYIDDHWGTKSGGLTWELGNELWGKFQVGYPTLQRVAERTKAFSGAVRRVDPNAVLIATGGDEDAYRDWNSTQLQNASVFNYLSTHFVVTTTAVQKTAPSEDFLALSNFALPIGLSARKSRCCSRRAASMMPQSGSFC